VSAQQPEPTQPYFHPLPPGSAVVSPEQMYAEIRATHDTVTRIELGLQSIPAEMKDHETRLRALERWTWRATGIATAVAAIVGAAAGLLSGRVG
jgi:hypothetical protein